MKNPGRLGLLTAVLVLTFAAWTAVSKTNDVKAAGGPRDIVVDEYSVLAPIERGNLLLFPVVRAGGKTPGETEFLTLDEGIRSGEVEVTEAGNEQGLVRQRGMIGVPPYGEIQRGVPQPDYVRGDQVNTLVLINHSKKPLLLLAGEIVTGGKQDRIVAKDRIVPVGSEPIDLSVFCIEQGRWAESSATFGAAAKEPGEGFMVQPAVREQAMVAKDQQQVWDSVHGAISGMQAAAAPTASTAMDGGVGSGASYSRANTTSYAKMMESKAVSEKVDEAAAPVMKAQQKVLAQLRQEHAVGVVVAVRGEIVWADLFADTDLLSRYWTKLVRSYAAESLAEGETHPAATVADAQHFLDAPVGGTETSEGDVGVYNYRELRSGDTETFVLESLLGGANYDVHISRMKLKEAEHRAGKPHPMPRYVPRSEPMIY